MASKRQVPLRPAPPQFQAPGAFGNSKPFVENKRHRVGVTIACDACRKKKIRCDGRKPTCSACHGKTEPCQYRDDSPTTKESSTVLLEVVKLLNVLPPDDLLRTLRHLRDEGDARTVLSVLRGGLEGNQRLSDLSTAVVIMDNTLQSIKLGAQYPTAYPRLRGITSEAVRTGLYHGLTVASESGFPKSPTLALPVPNQDNSESSSNSEPPPFAELDRSETIWLCDPRLMDLKIKQWTSVPISDDTAARAISIYLETDHPLLGHFDPDLFLSDLTAPREVYCSQLLVNALLFWACQMYTAVDSSVAELPLQFCTEAEKIWSAQKGKPESDTVLNLAAIQFLSMGYLGQGRDHAVLPYLAEMCEMGIRIGLYGIEDDRAWTRLERLSEEAARAYLYAAWGSFCWLTLNSIFYHQPHIACPRFPPKLPIPHDVSNETKPDTPGSVQTSSLPAYMGGLFPHLCRFWGIMHEVVLVYYTKSQVVDGHLTSLRFAEYKFRELLAWSSDLPSYLLRNGENPHYVQMLHLWFHAAVLDIFRPHVRAPPAVKRRLRTFSTSINTPDVIFHASVSQLKCLIIDYRINYQSSSYTLLWHTALIYVANAVMQESPSNGGNGDGDGRLFFLLICVYGYERLRRSWRVTEAITAGLLSMIISRGDMSSHKARDILKDLKQRSLGSLPGRIRATFMLDLDLAMSHPEAATAEELARCFEDNALMGDYTNIFGEQESHGD